MAILTNSTLKKGFQAMTMQQKYLLLGKKKQKIDD